MNGTAPIFLARPGAGQEARLSVGPDARLEFSFDPRVCTFSKDGRHLVLSFEDGGRLTLEDFYDNAPRLHARTARAPSWRTDAQACRTARPGSGGASAPD